MEEELKELLDQAMELHQVRKQEIIDRENAKQKLDDQILQIQLLLDGLESRQKWAEEYVEDKVNEDLSRGRFKLTELERKQLIADEKEKKRGEIKRERDNLEGQMQKLKEQTIPELSRETEEKISASYVKITRALRNYRDGMMASKYTLEKELNSLRDRNEINGLEEERKNQLEIFDQKRNDTFAVYNRVAMLIGREREDLITPEMWDTYSKWPQQKEEFRRQRSDIYDQYQTKIDEVTRRDADLERKISELDSKIENVNQFFGKVRLRDVAPDEIYEILFGQRANIVSNKEEPVGGGQGIEGTPIEEPPIEEPPIEEAPVEETPVEEEPVEEETVEEEPVEETPVEELVKVELKDVDIKELKEAIIQMRDSQQCSISQLQRKMKLGYAKAAIIVDYIEDMGIIGPFVGSKPRSILMTKEELTDEKIDELIGLHFYQAKEELVVEEPAPEEIVEEPPVVEETPAEEVASTLTPAEEVASTLTPAEEVASTSTPVEEVESTSTPAEEVAEEMLSKEQLLNIFDERKGEIDIVMGLLEHIEALGEGKNQFEIGQLYMNSLDEKHKIELASICKSAKDWYGVRKHSDELKKYYEDNLKEALPEFVVNYLLKQPIDIHVNEHGISINRSNIDPETIREQQENTVEEYIDELLDKNDNYDMNIIRAIVIKDQPTVVDGKCELSELAKKRLDTYCAMIDSPEANMDKVKITYDLKKMSGLRGLLAGSKWEKDDVNDIKESAKIAEELGCATVNVGFFTKVWWGIRRAIEGNNTPLIEESTVEVIPKHRVRVASAALTQEQYNAQQEYQQEIAEAFSKPGENGGKDEKLEDIDIPF